MLYCAYGSNCSLRQMDYRCPNSYVVCNGKLRGYKLVFNFHADVIKTDDDNFHSPIFHTIKEAKKFAEDFAAKENA